MNFKGERRNSFKSQTNLGGGPPFFIVHWTHFGEFGYPEKQTCYMEK